MRLHAYRVAQTVPSSPRFGLNVVTALGALTLDAMQPVRALLPAVTDAPALPAAFNLDAYTCYRVRSSSSGTTIPPGSEVTIMTGSPPATTRFAIRRPRYFCSPARLDGAALRNPGQHLVCFRTRPIDAPRRGLFAREVTVTDVARSDRLSTFGSREVCLPATLQ